MAQTIFSGDIFIISRHKQAPTFSQQKVLPTATRLQLFEKFVPYVEWVRFTPQEGLLLSTCYSVHRHLWYEARTQNARSK
jgi:hypothetical protein